MEGTSVCCWQRQETPRTRRWCQTLKSAGHEELFGAPRGGRTGERRDRIGSLRGGRSGAECHRVLLASARRGIAQLRSRGPRNGRRGAAAVMRYGYRRGTKPSKGVRVGGNPGRDPIQLRLATIDPGATRRTPGPVPAATCREPHSGENRRGGGKPRGRNASRSREARLRRSSDGPGKRTEAEMSVEGHTRRDVTRGGAPKGGSSSVPGRPETLALRLE